VITEPDYSKIPNAYFALQDILRGALDFIASQNIGYYWGTDKILLGDNAREKVKQYEKAENVK